jgi:hypothetical protein
MTMTTAMTMTMTMTTTRGSETGWLRLMHPLGGRGGGLRPVPRDRQRRETEAPLAV